MKEVALVVAHNDFQQIEYGEPKKALENAGFEVVTISNKPGLATGADGSTTQVDLTADQAKAEDYAGIYIIGGYGAPENIDIPAVHLLIQNAKRDGIPFGAICLATRILAHANVLEGKKVTGWNKDGLLPHIIEKHKAILVDKDVVVDGNIVTATGPEVAGEFAQEILKTLQ